MVFRAHTFCGVMPHAGTIGGIRRKMRAARKSKVAEEKAGVEPERPATRQKDHVQVEDKGWERVRKKHDLFREECAVNSLKHKMIYG